jgi:hypothetical protein
VVLRALKEWGTKMKIWEVILWIVGLFFLIGFLDATIAPGLLMQMTAFIGQICARVFSSIGDLLLIFLAQLGVFAIKAQVAIFLVLVALFIRFVWKKNKGGGSH